MSSGLFAHPSATPAGEDRHSFDTLDHILTAQFVVAWAGETGEERRLSWWRSDLTSEFGGEDLFRRLLPHTWPWATLQAAREVARLHDVSLRRRHADRDDLVTLYALGTIADERVEERLQDLKRSGRLPHEALSGLAKVIGSSWSPDRLDAWLAARGATQHDVTPQGRRIRGDVPSDLTEAVDRLLGALLPLAETYPMPHYVSRR